MSGTRLFTLGPPRLEREGVPLEVQYHKNLALIAYLAVTGERHTREALITLLWPELEPSRARANLRRNLSVLRKALGGEFLVVDRETVGLGPGDDLSAGGQNLWVDVDQFRRLLSAWRGYGYEEAEWYCQEAIRLGEEIDNRSAVNSASVDLAQIAYYRGEYSSAKRLYEEGLAHAEKRGQKYHVGMLCSFLGDTALAMGDYEGARALHERARALYQEMTVHWAEVASGQHYGVGYSLDRLGDMALAVGEIAQAKKHYQQALQIAREHPQVALSLDVLVSQAALLAQEGRCRERAVELAALALHHPRSHTEVTRTAQKLLHDLEAALLPDVFATAQKRGRALELEATVKELLADLSSR